MTTIIISCLLVFCARLLWDICKLEHRVEALEKRHE